MYPNDVDIVITTFKRNDCLLRLLDSIPYEFIERGQVTVADQNKSSEWVQLDGKYKNVRHEILPYDCGLSYARNHLIRVTKRPCILLLEDDFEWTEHTDIRKMITIMTTYLDIGVVGGQVRQNNVPIPFEFIPKVNSQGVLYHAYDGDNWRDTYGIKWKETGCVLNFALFWRDAVEQVMWDPELKLREHQDFYLRFNKTNWRVGYTPEVIINDAKPPRNKPEYQALKNRDEYLAIMMQKHGLKKIYYQNGSWRELIDGKIYKGRGAPLPKVENVDFSTLH